MSVTSVCTVHFGVGIDTARYGHYASFLGEDRQSALRGFIFQESHEGYERFQSALARLAERHAGNVQFHIRIDAAGQYAANLEAFLRRLPFSTTISIGESKRNKDYKNAHFPKRKADCVDGLACARFAIVEQPQPTPETPAEFLPLREVAAALQSQRRQTTRWVNQLHNRLARAFPELAVLAPDISTNWVLHLLDKYPTPERIAMARTTSLAQIPHLSQKRAETLQAAARASIASLRGKVAEQIIRHLVAELRQSKRAEEMLEQLLEEAFEALPDGGHRQLLTIPGIGRRTAAALVAKIVSIDRFLTAAALVNYFGAFPEENTSGVDKRGKPIVKGTLQMSFKGNDLVRGLLWMACQSAIRCNPAIRALYARQRALGKRGDVALGHCLRKMLHLVFAIWKTNRPFNPQHFPWMPQSEATTATPEPPNTSEEATVTNIEERLVSAQDPQATQAAEATIPQGAQQDAAGHTGQSPDWTVVTAAPTQLGTRSLSQETTPRKRISQASVNFAELRQQVSMADALRQAGLTSRLRGTGAQRRGPCPIHQPQQATGRSFSVNLDKNVFRCLDPACRAHGNVLDLWAALLKLPLRDAALHLAGTFQLNLRLATNHSLTSRNVNHESPPKNGVITPDAT